MKIFPVLAAALVLPAIAFAQERTAGQANDAQVNWAVLKNSIDLVSSQNKALAASMATLQSQVASLQASVNSLNTKVGAIASCGAQKKYWNGSGCTVASASNHVEVGTFSETNPYVLTNQFAGTACLRNGRCTGWNARASDAYCKGKGYDALIFNACHTVTVPAGNHDNGGTYPSDCTIRCIRTR